MFTGLSLFIEFFLSVQKARNLKKIGENCAEKAFFQGTSCEKRIDPIYGSRIMDQKTKIKLIDNFY